MVRTLFISFFALFTVSISLPGEAVPAKKLYDDFSSGYLSSDKWFPREYVKEISDGKLVLKLGNSSGMGVEYWPGMFRNNLGVASPEPETITAFESEITIMEATPDSAPNSRSFARIAGQFYNSNESDGQYGEIAFEIMIGDRGNGGLEAFWEASRVMENDPSNFEQITSGTLIGPGTLDTGVPYLVKVVYDNDRTLTFTVNGVTDEYIGPEKKRPAVNPVRSIGACIDAADGSNDGFIHTTFDNVVLNNAAEIYEGFSSPLIDLSKWDQTEWVRECSSKHLRANVRRIGGWRHAVTYLTSEKNTPYFEAKVRIESDTQLSPGAYGIARLGGYYYNETRGTGSGVDYNRYEGDVFAQIRLRYDSDGTIQAQAWADRSNDADQNSFTELFWHTFSTPIALDTYYVLSITYEDNLIIFQCEDEQAVFNIQTNAYPPYGIHRQIRTWLRADSGESGYLKASYDDIYIADPPVVTSILSSASPDHTITSGSNEQVYGTSAINTITLESGAKAELINFPGQNSIQIQPNSDLFTVSRSGTLVTFEGSDGTILKIPATTSVQTVDFSDRLPMTLSIHGGQVMLDDQVVTTTAAAIFAGSGLPGPCGAYVAPNVWKEFDCYNLAAIGKTTNDNPFTPSWSLIGGYWQWGRKGPDSSLWYATTTEHFAQGPTGVNADEANDGEITEWDQTYAPDGAWSDDYKTTDDPCPEGFRVPTLSQWEGVVANNIQNVIGTWSTIWNDSTNYSSARYFGSQLMLPAGGYRDYDSGALYGRGINGSYWSSTESTSDAAWYLNVYESYESYSNTNHDSRRYGCSIRCVAE